MTVILNTEKFTIIPTMECDYEEKLKKLKDMIGETSWGKGRKKSLFAKRLENKKPVFDPELQVKSVRFHGECHIISLLSEIQIWKNTLTNVTSLILRTSLGDQEVRCKYRSVVPNDFGLDKKRYISFAVSSAVLNVIYWFIVRIECRRFLLQETRS